MTPVERYTHLKQYWRQLLEERKADVAEAELQFEHWSNKLVAAKMAEQLAKEDDK